MTHFERKLRRAGWLAILMAVIWLGMRFAGVYPDSPRSFTRDDIVASQRAAVRKHPALAVAGSPFNKAFIARHAEWRTAHDPRLERSNWPEVLADECEVALANVQARFVPAGTGKYELGEP